MRNKLYLNNYGRNVCKGQLGEVFIGHGKDVCHHFNSCEINSLAELGRVGICQRKRQSQAKLLVETFNARLVEYFCCFLVTSHIYNV